MYGFNQGIPSRKDLYRTCRDSYRKNKTTQPCSNWSDLANGLLPLLAILGKLAAAVLWVGPTPRGGYALNILIIF